MTQSQPSARLSDGSVAVLEPDHFNPGAWLLVVEGTPQSQVHPDHPEELFFEYVRRIGHLVDLVRPPGEAITALHLGAGALSLPRYIAATRPGSRQQVIELERALVDLVREHLPWSKSASLRIRYGDARAMLEQLPPGLLASADLIVADIFQAARTPAHVTTVEFFASAGRYLAPEGILAVNVADGPGLHFTRRQAATLKQVFGQVIALAEPGLLKGHRYGNVVLAASRTPLRAELLPRLLAGGPHPAKLVEGRELDRFIGGAAAIEDAAQLASPSPDASLFKH